MKMKRPLLALIALVLCSAAAVPAPPPPVWTPTEIALLRHWIDTAPEDALPVLATGALDTAQSKGDQAAIDSAATALALRLARMFLLGCSTPAERAGWHIVDTDASIDLRARLERALATDGLDAFFAGLQPQSPQYAALRDAYATETDPVARETLARNMERWRWMPHSLGPNYVLVNAADFKATLWRHGERVGTWRVIVGKRSTPTPVFSTTITGVIYNPWWDVPASIVRESVGRLVRRHPSLARRRGYVWSGGRYRQRPGANNALGRMKLVMPNPYHVYMHDTPAKKLFERDVRTFSHGCIRTGNALDFAATLLDGKITPAEADAIIASGKTTRIDLPTRIPVYVTYFTATMRPDGTVAILPDVYKRDSRIGDPASRSDGCKG